MHSLGGSVDVVSGNACVIWPPGFALQATSSLSCQVSSGYHLLCSVDAWDVPPHHSTCWCARHIHVSGGRYDISVMPDVWVSSWPAVSVWGDGHRRLSSSMEAGVLPEYCFAPWRYPLTNYLRGGYL